MTYSQLIIYLLRYYIPAVWSLIFRAVGFGYKSKRRVVIGIVVYTLYLMVVPSILITIMGYGAYTHIVAIVMLVGSMAALIFTTDSFVKTMFLQLSQGGMITILSVILSCIRTVAKLSYANLLILFGICCPLLFFFALRHWAKPMRFLVDNLPDKTPSLLVIPFLVLILVNIIPVYPPQTFTNHPLYSSLLIEMIELAYFLYIYSLYKNIKHISDLTHQNNFTKTLRKEILSYQAYVDNARKNSHDLRHHDAVILSLLQDGNVNDAITYLNEHGKILTEAVLKQYCQNSTVNALLRVYEQRAQEAGVKFLAQATISPETTLSGPELCGVLGNILENALRSSQEVPSGYINCSITQSSQCMLARVTNSVAKKVPFKGKTPVSPRPNGGTGIKSIQSILDKHGGSVEYSNEGNLFITRVIVPEGE